ncbi:hypothetical protein QR680_017010 [Steinernema hermaphroditum]|uniref:Uncharacterized protein n=1 Tax=Steinernema hermaphroditum TaxID=289476 RepID=A0AA39HCZ5_9BILA|nr:hypothetical protein QR680_017008 [Steinernema hermaphroditum]KAK0403585.1 hypothetical protein QR680_017010 [Steinernema hermaphroditum]
MFSCVICLSLLVYDLVVVARGDLSDLCHTHDGPSPERLIVACNVSLALEEDVDLCQRIVELRGQSGLCRLKTSSSTEYTLPGRSQVKSNVVVCHCVTSPSRGKRDAPPSAPTTVAPQVSTNRHVTRKRLKEGVNATTTPVTRPGVTPLPGTTKSLGAPPSVPTVVGAATTQAPTTTTKGTGRVVFGLFTSILSFILLCE